MVHEMPKFYVKDLIRHFFNFFKWRYDPRLTLRDLNPDNLQNSVSPGDKQKLWLPAFAFVNALGTVDSSLIDAKMFLDMETEPYTRGQEEAVEGNLS